ncbi:PH domain-containing protein [Janibacter melonis]|uniref:PH domain-containing protein n=1 Tax=Janibacter melonis TaxID=262209 RepID=UPI001F1F5F30|nr:PH domain-containing protein [Janibacter melonis]
MPAVSGRGRRGDGTDAPFVPRRGRLVASVLAVLTLVIFLLVAIFVPERFHLVDRLGFFLIGLGVAGLLSRYMTIRAVPRADGLLVRNLGPQQVVPWEDIEAVRFSDGMPWVRLDLADGDDMAVMAIQRADGSGSLAQAQRLSDLVGAHQR